MANLRQFSFVRPALALVSNKLGCRHYQAGACARLARQGTGVATIKHCSDLLSPPRFSTSSVSQAQRIVGPDNRSKTPSADEHVDEFEAVSTYKEDPNAPVDTDFLNRKDWVSHGYSEQDEDEDKIQWHAWNFGVISLIACGVGFVIAYKPYSQHIDWCHREGLLELRRRERLGLPLIDMDLVPRERVVLPTEEELGDFHVHI